MRTQKYYFLFLIIVCMLFASCRMSKGEAVESVEEDGISVIRYDKLLDEYVRFNSFTALQKMNTEYMHPTKLLIEDVLAIGAVNDDHILQRLRTFYSDTTLLHLMADVETKYADLSDIEEQLTHGFRKLKKEIPALEIPTVYSQISALNESVVVADTLLGISLDKYMGEDYPLYKRFYYGYQRHSMRPDRIVPDCFMFYLMSQYPFPIENGRSLLHVILHYGRIHYAVQQILDYHSSEDAMGYSEEEKQWCRDNKRLVWDHILKNNHLHTTDPMIVRYYTKPSPFIDLFDQNAPARVGTWLGTQIVSSYMKHHKDVSLRELMELNDLDVMFEESRFNP